MIIKGVDKPWPTLVRGFKILQMTEPKQKNRERRHFNMLVFDKGEEMSDYNIHNTNRHQLSCQSNENTQLLIQERTIVNNPKADTLIEWNRKRT